MSNAGPYSTVMLFQAVGTPSVLTYGVFALLQTLLNTVYGDHFLIQAMYLEDIKARWATLDRNDLKPVILVSDCPSTDLTGLIASTRLPVLVIVDDFADCVRHAVSARGLPLPEALRFATQSYCAVGACRAEEKLTVTARDRERPMREILGRFASHFGLSPVEDVVRQTLAALSLSGDEVFRAYIAGLWPEPSANEVAPSDREREAIVDLIAPAYEALGRGKEVARIAWPTEMFLDWDRPGQFLRGPIDLDGPARFIICGPYFHLCAGPWKAEISIQVAANRSGNRLSVDVFCGDIIGGITAPLPLAGSYSFPISFTVVDPFLPLELRFQTGQGAIEGYLTLQAVSFSRPVELTPSGG